MKKQEQPDANDGFFAVYKNSTKKHTIVALASDLKMDKRVQGIIDALDLMYDMKKAISVDVTDSKKINTKVVNSLKKYDNVVFVEVGKGKSRFNTDAVLVTDLRDVGLTFGLVDMTSYCLQNNGFKVKFAGADLGEPRGKKLQRLRIDIIDRTK